MIVDNIIADCFSAGIIAWIKSYDDYDSSNFWNKVAVGINWVAGLINMLVIVAYLLYDQG